MQYFKILKMDESYVIINDENKESKKSKELIKIKDGFFTMICPNIKDVDIITVFSIVGIARTGKSSLLNCMGSYLLKKNVNIFNVSDTDEHCTSGIDMYYFQEQSIVLLDCQGLKLDDSSNDPKLLLITYLISDCIIYNQRSMLNNDIFDTLQSLATFVNYVDNVKHKPVLYFRLLDTELKFDPKILLEKTLAEKNDQYQNVRSSIKQLFSDVQIGTTLSLDRSEKQMLSNKKYDEFIKSNNMFDNVIKSILKIKGRQITFDEWMESIFTFIDNINKNKKIDFSKFDVYNLLIRDEIREFRDNINETNYMDFTCGILQEEFDKIVQPKIDFMNNCLITYKEKFKMVNSSYFDKNYEELYNKLNNPIQKVIKTIERLTRNMLETEKNTYFEKYGIWVLDGSRMLLQKAFENRTHEMIIYNYYKIINKYYKPEVVKHKEIFNIFIKDCQEYVDKLINAENVGLCKLNEYEKAMIDNYDGIYELILKYSCSQIKCDNIMDLKKHMYRVINVLYVPYKNKIIKTDMYIDNIEFNYNTSFEIIIDLKNLKINSNNVFNKDKSKQINKTIDDLHTKFMNDSKINTILMTKIKQNKLFVLDKNKLNVKDGMCNYGRLHMNLSDGVYDKKVLKKNMYLREFKKFLQKRYAAKIILKNNAIFNALLYETENKDNNVKYIRRLHKIFTMDRNVLSNKMSNFVKLM